MRAVIDTNVVVSRYLSSLGNPARIFEFWREERFDLVVSSAILAEYEQVLKYDRLHRLSDEEIAEVIDDFLEFSVSVEVNTPLSVITEDPDDDKFLEAALAGSAEYVVSGDPHLPKLQVFQGITVLSPAAFVKLLQWDQG